MSQSGLPQDFPFTQRDFTRIAAMLHQDAGIALRPEKTALVYSRLARRLRALRLDSFDAYCELVASPDGAAERRSMLQALTTNVTRFFREPHHFEHLRSQVVPLLAASMRAGGRVRLWSAACSTGQEPFSMAMTVLDACPELAARDLRILATDIDRDVLAAAAEATYPEEQVRDIPPPLRARFLVRAGSFWRMADPVRRLVVFRPLNLIGDWPMRERFQVIFCRNVAIYFDEPTQARLWQRFAERLTPEGRLYIGHSERIEHPALALDGLTTYRRLDPA